MRPTFSFDMESVFRRTKATDGTITLQIKSARRTAKSHVRHLPMALQNWLAVGFPVGNYRDVEHLLPL